MAVVLFLMELLSKKTCGFLVAESMTMTIGKVEHIKRGWIQIRR